MRAAICDVDLAAPQSRVVPAQFQLRVPTKERRSTMVVHVCHRHRGVSRTAEEWFRIVVDAGKRWGDLEREYAPFKVRSPTDYPWTKPELKVHRPDCLSPGNVVGCVCKRTDLVCRAHGRRHSDAFTPAGKCEECRDAGVDSQGHLAMDGRPFPQPEPQGEPESVRDCGV